jgi:4a-hydroxytetrahydrobiopterin dehydratase
MNQLTAKTCVSCSVEARLATQEEINVFMQQLPNWVIVEEDKIKKLQRILTFNNFTDTMRFTQNVSDLAEKENHHPTILTEWGKVTICWWSHKIKGLHLNDFIMAAKTDQLLT